MQSKKEQKKLGREKLERIIEMCMAIENHTVDPFLLDVDDIIIKQTWMKELFALLVKVTIFKNLAHKVLLKN